MLDAEFGRNIGWELALHGTLFHPVPRPLPLSSQNAGSRPVPSHTHTYTRFYSGLIWTTASTSTEMSRGRVEVPMADRAW
jgi:hypothetical protein